MELGKLVWCTEHTISHRIWASQVLYSFHDSRITSWDSSTVDALLYSRNGTAVSVREQCISIYLLLAHSHRVERSVSLLHNAHTHTHTGMDDGIIVANKQCEYVISYFCVILFLIEFVLHLPDNCAKFTFIFRFTYSHYSSDENGFIIILIHKSNIVI